MRHFYGGAVPMHRFFGAFTPEPPRRLIPSGLRDLPPGGADQPLPHPSGDADPRQLGGLPDQVLVLLKQPQTEGSGLSLISLWSSHSVSVGPITLQVKSKNPSYTLDL